LLLDLEVWRRTAMEAGQPSPEQLYSPAQLKWFLQEVPQRLCQLGE
jgi:hypothetical protein